MIFSGYSYTCSAGESFDSIALALYGNENHAPELMRANPEHCRKCVFLGGEELKLPVVEVKNTTMENAYKPAKAPWKE
ncbi:MAG: LysM domain-containing protein [Clostridia bacterium]|nr:LysM domain-containing protein [Clostridia bacterium]